jgi:signal transduction histidine kinase
MIRILLSVTFGAVLALAIGCAALACWGSYQASYQFERTRLTHGTLAEYLRLKIALDAVMRDATLDVLGAPGDRDDAIDVAAAHDRLHQQFDAVRQAIAAEVALVPDSQKEKADLNVLAALEIQAHGVADRLERAVALFAAGEQVEARSLLRSELASPATNAVRLGIDSAVNTELAEAAAADVAANAAMATVSALSRTAVIAATIFAVLSLVVLVRRIKRPLDRLAEVAAAVAAGDLSRRIAGASMQDEFGRVASSLNTMLDEVVRSRQALERNRDTLEQSVLSRTAELAAANATLRRGDDARRRFLAEVSHELRTPLTVIRGEAEIALRGTDQPVPIYKQALARIAEEAAGTARLVDDLLFVARSEAGEVRFAVQAVAMDSVVQRAAAAARTIGESRAVRVTEQLGRNGVVLGDADRLRRLVLILLDNAVRYSRPGGEVEVTLTATAEAVQLTVQDHGIGIALEDQERVFERFYRGPGAAQLHAGGSGLGLPLARAIARAHGGELTLDSRPGEGTTLRVMLPAARQLQAVA